MGKSNNLLESIWGQAEDYINATFELSKLTSIQLASALVASLISRVVIVLVLSVMLVTINIGLALYLGSVLSELYYGFFIVGAFYLIALVVLYYYLFDWIKEPISTSIIKEIQL
jgi:hypothetical protein